MMDQREASDMIEACRPGSADVDLPEMAALAEQLAANPDLRRRYEQTQRLDARLVDAIGDVPVPQGLRERMLLAVRAGGVGDRDQAPGDTLAASLATRFSRAADSENIAASSAIRSRRRTFIAIAAVAAALLIFFGGYWFWPRRPAFTYDRLLTLGGQWFAQMRAHADWQPLPPHEIVRDYPPPDAIRTHPDRWADVSDLIGTPACAYGLTTFDGRRAVLFVIYQPAEIANSTPALTPASSTGGLTIGCWQSGNLAYVLAVEGTDRSYRSLLNETAPPLAFIGLRNAMVLLRLL
jgi:hypothetical protein